MASDHTIALKETGPSQPLSTAEPTEEEKQLSKLFEAHIDKTKESREDSRLRERTLAWLDELVKEWVGHVAEAKGISDALNLGGRIFTFGSYRLGVHGPGADIDTLVVAPRHVGKEDFFSSFIEELKAKDPGRVTDISPVPDAATPVMKMNINGLSLDLLFASIDARVIPNSFDPTVDKVLHGVDEGTQRSLNGTRVAGKMLHCVPNVDVFRAVLRGVKRWAQTRGVYGNVFGYPGGVAWAILVARVCQLYPKACAGMVFIKFFKYYKSWWKRDPEYPHNLNNPIYVTGTLDLDLEYGFRVWSRQKYQTDRYDILPIITPCYPFMNTCYNTTKITLRVMCDEIHRAADLHEKLHNAGEIDSFEQICAPRDFFYRYPQYLRVSAAALDADSARKWAGFCESRMRRLLAPLQQITSGHFQMWPEKYEQEMPTSLGTRFESSWFIGMGAAEPQQSSPQQGSDGGTGRKVYTLDLAWETFRSYTCGIYLAKSTFERSGSMLDPEQKILKRKQLLTECAYALTDHDKVEIERVLKDAKQARKRKREGAVTAETPTPATSPVDSAIEVPTKTLDVAPMACGDMEQTKRARCEATELPPPPGFMSAPQTASSNQPEDTCTTGTSTSHCSASDGGAGCGAQTGAATVQTATSSSTTGSSAANVWKTESAELEQRGVGPTVTLPNSPSAAVQQPTSPGQGTPKSGPVASNSPQEGTPRSTPHKTLSLTDELIAEEYGLD